MKNSTAAVLAVSLSIAGAAAGYGWATRSQAPVAAAPAKGAPAERKVLYYRNPMGLPDTSPTPKKDPMGMDYIAVYAGEEPAGPAQGSDQVRISVEKVQKLGVRTEAASMRPLGGSVRASGRVEPDERRVFAISPKFEGYVERLHVNATGQPIGKGQALFEVYSPELVSAQREYAIAEQGVRSMGNPVGDAASGMRHLAEASLLRLRNWDIPPDQIRELARTGEARRTMTFRSPVGGVVTEKKALQGMRFMPGDVLYQVTDLSVVWVIADVYEQDIGKIRTGSKATVKLDAYPGKTFTGPVTYVYPTLKAETRTVPVRIELANPGQLLKPAMYTQVEMAVGGDSNVLAVPDSAVIDSGTRKLVLVQLGEGRFEPREVKIGARSDNYAQVLQGVKEGEQVVVSANFLIDAESNLKAAVGGLGGAPAQGTAANAPARAASASQQAGQAAAGIGHRASGTVEGIDARTGAITLNHGAVESLKWPAMTMEFNVATPALVAGLAPGAKVDVEFVERKPGEWVITSVTRH
jgi:Cu(I)/Ag(I) efflux system membrane fusion protein